MDLNSLENTESEICIIALISKHRVFQRFLSQGTDRKILSLHILFCSGGADSVHHSWLVFVYTSLRNLGCTKDQRGYLSAERNVIFIDWDVLADRRGSQCPDRKSHSGEPPPGSTSQGSEVRSIEHEWQHLHTNTLTWVRGLERHWDLASRLLFR